MRAAPLNTLNENIRNEPEEPCSLQATASVTLQGALIAVINTVVMVTIVVRASDEGQAYLSWAICAALVIGGAITALQASRIGRFGAGHLLLCGAGPHWVAISVVAINVGGWTTLASLIVVSSLVQFAFAAWLPVLRRIITPVVCGASLMLISISVIAVAVEKLARVPEGTPVIASPLVVAATLGAAVVISLKGSGILRLWAPLMGILSGCIVAAVFNLYDLEFLKRAPWFQMPSFDAWPGLDLSLGTEFWTLLPTFVIVTLVVAVKTGGDGVVMQQVSLRRSRAIDFRVVQGTVNASGLGGLLSGLAGTPPTVVYSPSSISLISLTGIAFRGIGYWIGGVLILVAFFPKITALLLAAPSAVVGSLLLMVMGMLLVEGMRMIFREGLDQRNTLIVAITLAVGLGVESLNVFGMRSDSLWISILGNGTTVGILVMISLTTLLELTSPRAKRLEVELRTSSLPRIDGFLNDFAANIGWNEESANRLRAAGEESLLCLLSSGTKDEEAGTRLIVSIRSQDSVVEMDLLCVFEEQNIEDRLAYMSEEAQVQDDRELSFRLLRHHASSVHHRKYHGVDIITVQVERIG
ncbi:MAG: hypothetical protein F4089_07435 [Gammaproteobacteria bacterium]|nr:hypothetical protein [Gammaproteobacteria bacterium]